MGGVELIFTDSAPLASRTNLVYTYPVVVDSNEQKECSVVENKIRKCERNQNSDDNTFVKLIERYRIGLY